MSKKMDEAIGLEKELLSEKETLLKRKVELAKQLDKSSKEDSKDLITEYILIDSRVVEITEGIDKAVETSNLGTDISKSLLYGLMVGMVITDLPKLLTFLTVGIPILIYSIYSYNKKTDIYKKEIEKLRREEKDDN